MTELTYHITLPDGTKIEVNVLSFDGKQVRVAWDGTQEKYLFSVVDVINILTDQKTPRGATIYWGVLKKRLREEGSELFTNCNQLKLRSLSDGKLYATDVADTEQLLRIIQSVPSKKAEPIKQWLSGVGAERLSQMQDPELDIEQAVRDYQNLGYDEKWINQRIHSIEVRKELTDEWKRSGVVEDRQFAMLTDIISRAWSGMSTRQYKDYKGLRKESLRDNMSNIELALTSLAEATATELSRQENPDGFDESAEVAQRGGKVAHTAREAAEKELGHSVLSPKNAIDRFTPKNQIPFPKDKDDE